MSNSDKVVVQSGGIGLGGLLFVVFLVLKLLKVAPVAAWSWWWVTAPLWIPFVIVMALLLIGLILAGIAGMLN